MHFVIFKSSYTSASWLVNRIRNQKQTMLYPIPACHSLAGESKWKQRIFVCPSACLWYLRGACHLMTSDKWDSGGFGCSRTVLGSWRCDLKEVEGLSDNVNIVCTLTARSAKLKFHSLHFRYVVRGPVLRGIQSMQEWSNLPFLDLHYNKQAVRRSKVRVKVSWQYFCDAKVIMCKTCAGKDLKQWILHVLPTASQRTFHWWSVLMCKP